MIEAVRKRGGSCPVGSGATPYVAGTNRLAGVSYDGVGNQTSIFQGDTTVYDAEGRVTAVMNGATTVAAYQYDADGRRVQKTTAAGTTNYVYDDSGALLAEYAGAALTKEYVRFHSEYIPSNVDLVAVENATASGSECTTCFVIPDYLGNVRMVADNAGNASSRHDYLPFGEEAVADGYRLSSGGFGGADGLTQRFTGKERDPEEGLDYFGARYYGSVLGRFTGPDMSAGSAALTRPQTWNRYLYGLDNPLRYVDPSGELWAVANGGFSWVDQCDNGQTCYKAVAAASTGGLVVYGSAGAKDVTTITANKNGYIDMSEVADLNDAHFEIKDGAASYLSLDRAASFFNTAEQYHEEYPNDDDLFVTDMGNSDGSRLPPHATHDLGRAVDVRYVGLDGRPIRSATAADEADAERVGDLVDIASDNGFNQNYSAKPKDFGTYYAKGHESHLHLGSTKPVEKIKPPAN